MAANIFSDFFEHSDPDLVDTATCRRPTVYALDANILINLYRYSDDTADQYVKALSSMQGSLFVPHQAIKEFWANRDHVRKGVHHSEAKGKIESGRKSLLKSFREWSVRSNVAVDQTSEELIAGIDEAVAAIIAHIDASSSGRTQDADDAITRGLNEAIGDQVGDPPTKGELTELHANFEQRIEEGLDTPGAADVTKGDDRSAGDFIFWKQCLAETLRRTSANEGPIDLTIVTDEVKEDWVRPSVAGTPKRARLGLVREYYDLTGGTLRLIDRRGILDIASEQFGASISESAREQVDKVESIDEREWSDDMVKQYLSVLLNAQNFPQLKLLIALAVAKHELGWSGIRKEDVTSYLGRTGLRGFTRAFQTPLRRTAFQRVNDAGADRPMVTLDWTSEVFRIESSAVDTVLSICEDDSDYGEYADIARSWLRSGGDLAGEPDAATGGETCDRPDL